MLALVKAPAAVIVGGRCGAGIAQHERYMDVLEASRKQLRREGAIWFS